MNIVEQIAESPFGEVTVGGLTYRLRKINSRELLAAKSRHLVATLAHRPGEEYAPETDPEHIMADEIRKLDEADKFLMACVCAVRVAPDDPWEPLRLVATEEEQDATAGRLHIEALAIPMRVELAQHAVAHTMSREGAATIDSFRKRSGPAASGGGTGEEVQQAAP